MRYFELQESWATLDRYFYDIAHLNGKEVHIYKNLNPRLIKFLRNNSDYKEVRGIHHNSDTYWWDANQADHLDVKNYLNIRTSYEGLTKIFYDGFGFDILGPMVDGLKKISSVLSETHSLKEAKTDIISGSNGDELKVWVNPSAQEIANLLTKIPVLRGEFGSLDEISSLNLYVWDAYDSNHGRTKTHDIAFVFFKNRQELFKEIPEWNTYDDVEYNEEYGFYFLYSDWSPAEIKNPKVRRALGNHKTISTNTLTEAKNTTLEGTNGEIQAWINPSPRELNVLLKKFPILRGEYGGEYGERHDIAVWDAMKSNHGIFPSWKITFVFFADPDDEYIKQEMEEWIDSDYYINTEYGYAFDMISYNGNDYMDAKVRHVLGDYKKVRRSSY